MSQQYLDSLQKQLVDLSNLSTTVTKELKKQEERLAIGREQHKGVIAGIESAERQVAKAMKGHKEESALERTADLSEVKQMAKVAKTDETLFLGMLDTWLTDRAEADQCTKRLAAIKEDAKRN